MYEWAFRFYGRNIGAIGVASQFIGVTVAETHGEAILALYNTWEHIHGAGLLRKEEVAHVRGPSL